MGRGELRREGLHRQSVPRGGPESVEALVAILTGLGADELFLISFGLCGISVPLQLLLSVRFFGDRLAGCRFTRFTSTSGHQGCNEWNAQEETGSGHVKMMFERAIRFRERRFPKVSKSDCSLPQRLLQRGVAQIVSFKPELDD
jgi:hypothetical protein